MSSITEVVESDCASEGELIPLLWWVQLDTNLGEFGPPDWENNINHPQPLGEALAHAEEVRTYARVNWQVFDPSIVRLVPEFMSAAE